MSNKYPQFPNTQFPESVDTYSSLIDLSDSDLALVKGYQQALENGDRVSALNYLAQIPNAEQKIVTATRLNQFRESILAMENFYGTDVEPYIDTKQGEWEAYVDRFEYKGVWKPTQRYTKNNIVQFDNNGIIELYICTNENTPVGASPVTIQYWRVFTVQGAQGDSGVGTSFDFDWTGAKEYAIDTIVVYDNKWWISTKVSQNEPPSMTSEFWDLVLEVGQALYPISPLPPVSQTNGEFWFREV